MDPIYLVIGGIVLFILYRNGTLASLLAKLKAPAVAADDATGRPIIDLMAEAAIEKYKAQPRVVEIIKAHAQQIDDLMTAAKVPPLPDVQPKEVK